jgi:dienelactone hydrolase
MYETTPSSPRSSRRRWAMFLASGAMAAGLAVGAVIVATPAAADEIGQAPTAQNITGTGSFATAQTTITNASGFGGGIAYYPTTAGRYPVIAVSPGFTAAWSSLSWLGPRVASWGFVIVGIETNSRFDRPTARGTQLRNALNWAVNSSPTAVRDRVDGSRRGVAGHSMGGGGTLAALSQDTTGLIKAGVAIAAWNDDKTWAEVNEPVFFVSAQNDTTATNSQHSSVFYNSITGQKGYLEAAGAGHTFPQQATTTTANQLLSRGMVAWMKRQLSGDARFTPFTCGFGGTTGVSAFLSNAC